MVQHQTHETHTERAERHGPVGHTEHTSESATSTTATIIAVGLGVLGVIAGLVPGFWFVALPAGLVALAIAEPVRRSGPGTAGHRAARYAVILAVVALALSVINFVVVFGGFSFFNVDGDAWLS